MQFSGVNKTTDSVIILWISCGVSAGLLPFSIIRIIHGDTLIAALNTSAFLFALIISVYVFLTHKTYFARWGLSILCVLLMAGTIKLKGHEQIPWVYPALTAVFYLLPSHLAGLVSGFFMLSVVYIVWPDLSDMSMLRFTVSASATFLFSYAFSARMRKQAIFLSQMAITDPLTGAGNRRALEEKMLEITTRLNRQPEQSCSLIMFDLDHFKDINDRHGHGAGDKVLKKFSNLITERIRQTDSLYRFGGEEFVVILESTSSKEALALADELRKHIKNSQWHINNLRITVSAGVAQFIGTESTYEWLSRADGALYRAKSSGRDCCLASELDN